MSSAYPSPDPHRLPDPSSTRPTRAPGGFSKLLMYVLFILALFATVVMFFVDNDVWMNIAVIAALWAAFIGAVLVSRYSGALGEESSRNRERDARRAAEMEAERAEHRRREVELEQSYATREDAGRDETLESIRLELAALREQLSELSGLDLSEDQVAVRARAERIIELERHIPGTETPGGPAGATGTSGPTAPDPAGETSPVSPFASPFPQRPPAPRGAGAAAGTPSQDRGRQAQSRAPHHGARRNGFATGTFSAVNWAGADSEETSMIPLIVDTRDTPGGGETPAADPVPTPGAVPAETPEQRRTETRVPAEPTLPAEPVEPVEQRRWSEPAPSFPTPAAGHHEAVEEESGHHRRRRAEAASAPEDTRGRRRADERPADNGSVTVAELMAQLKKNAR
ncbi:DUF6779 domain-containing protein [uncultured Corynebacterium sp.]|uniref:DUF6779 domain-containing protein n=1 Tax=uncultured Corynebacterium sp. TaxID=159447 RepID=UPI0025D7D62B|nr:DUF6779 domain-containing protein [uncultured Corynebacterium sp.]